MNNNNTLATVDLSHREIQPFGYKLEYVWMCEWVSRTIIYSLLLLSKTSSLNIEKKIYSWIFVLNSPLLFFFFARGG